jgi:hypothetical protein
MISLPQVRMKKALNDFPMVVKPSPEEKENRKGKWPLHIGAPVSDPARIWNRFTKVPDQRPTFRPPPSPARWYLALGISLELGTWKFGTFAIPPAQIPQKGRKSPNPRVSSTGIRPHSTPCGGGVYTQTNSKPETN